MQYIYMCIVITFLCVHKWIIIDHNINPHHSLHRQGRKGYSTFFVHLSVSLLRIMRHLEKITVFMKYSYLQIGFWNFHKKALF